MKLDISFIDRIRFEFIETKLLWDDGITANDLAEIFEISRQAAQRVIKDYKNNYPNQMVYKSNLNHHIPTKNFNPKFIKEDPSRFIDYLRGHSLVEYYRNVPDWTEFDVIDIDRYMRPKLKLKFIRPVIKALKDKQVILMDYRKKEIAYEDITTRKVSPHHLVYADGRYHIRAFCHWEQRYLDFVISRISFAEITNDEWISGDRDDGWNQKVTLKFKPNPNLPKHSQEALLKNFDVNNSGVWELTVREALGYYIKRKCLNPDYKYKIPLWVLI